MTTEKAALINPAQLKQQDGIAFSLDYDDYYHSKLDALAEAEYVFLQGNQLAQRWQHQDYFSVVETGFGTGLNSLATLKAWQTHPAPPRLLQIYSVEKHPLSAEQLKAIYSANHALQPYADHLIQHYPPLLKGFHTLVYPHPSLPHCIAKLTLCFMDIHEALTQLPNQVDAWYLDGFAPSKNPDMWALANFKRMAKLSHRQTRLATFTAASQVRRDLETAGFKVTKRKGFGKKREMITAQLNLANQKQPKGSSFDDSNQVLSIASDKPWFSYQALPQYQTLALEPKTNLPQKTHHLDANEPSSHPNQRLSTPKHKRRVAIIGAGIAGCQLAWHLSRKGYSCQLIERQADSAQEASGNLAGAIFPKMTASPSLGEDFYQACYLYVLQQLALLGDTSSWLPCGVLQLSHNAREQQRWSAIQQRDLPKDYLHAVNAEQASHIAGINLAYSALHFPQGGCINPKRFCQALLNDANSELLTHNDVKSFAKAPRLSVSKTHDTTPWQLLAEDNTLIAEADILVLASGRSVEWLDQQLFPSQWVKGQTSIATMTHNPHLASTAHSNKLNCVLGHAGYIAPCPTTPHNAVKTDDHSERYVFGASFERHVNNMQLEARLDEVNIAQCQQYLPEVMPLLQSVNSGHAAVRVGTPDRLPYVGALPNSTYYQQHYADLQLGKAHKPYPLADYASNLYISMGYGSRGLTTSALCSELLASIIHGEPLPMSKTLIQAVHPARFLVKQLKSGV